MLVRLVQHSITMAHKAEQIDRPLMHRMGYGYRLRTKWFKTCMARRERARFRKDPDCAPHYNRYDGYVL
jgi:hypothetical protein